ncbi:DUF2029 domain-containing protein [Mariniblastus sp.]|nr:DUF2029 domain-containing protein [Mariniblastus sp.]
MQSQPVTDDGLLKKVLTGKTGYVLAIIFAVLSAAFPAYRAHSRYATPSRVFEFSNSAMTDFHNGSYFPSKAFAQRINPYANEVCEHFAMSRSSPPYSPMIFILHQPFTWLDLPAADIAYFTYSLLLIAGLAWCTVLAVRKLLKPDSRSLLNWIGDDRLAAIWAFGLIMFSRPGHITLFTGYFTTQLVIGTLLSLHFARSKPWLAGVGMLLASGKPTYIIPLMILMFFRRDFKAIVIGFVLCAIFAGGGIAWLASNSSVQSVFAGVWEGQVAHHADPSELPVNTWTRLDIISMIAKIGHLEPSSTIFLTGMLVMLIPVGILIWRVRDRETNPQSLGLTSSIAILALLVTLYHHSYDAILILPLWLALLLGGRAIFGWLRDWERFALLALLTVPVVNYVATLRFRELFKFDNQSLSWNVIASANGICLTLGLILLLMVSLRKPETSAE